MTVQERDRSSAAASQPGAAGHGPRCDDRAERLVIGAALHSLEAYEQAAAILRGGEDFYRPHHAMLWQKIRQAAADGAYGPMAVLALLDDRQCRQVDNGAYLSTCMSEGLPAWVARAASTVRSLAIARELQGFAAQVAHRAATVAPQDVEDTYAQVTANLAAIEHTPAGDGPIRLADLLDPTQARMEELADQAASKAPMGILTGWRDLDLLLVGLRPGQLVITAGRPGIGKSLVGTNIAWNAAAGYDLPVLIHALEMSAEEVVMRLASAGARVPIHNIRAGTLTDDDWMRLARWMHDAAQAPIYIDDRSAVGPDDAVRSIRQMTRLGHPPKLLVWDYLQLTTLRGERGSSRQEQVSAMSRQFKIIAGAHQLTVLALSQLNRGPEQRTDKRPQLSDLRESGSQEQDADVVILLHRDDYYDKESPRAGEADFIVAKNRNGPTDCICVAAQLHLSRFVDLAISA